MQLSKTPNLKSLISHVLKLYAMNVKDASKRIERQLLQDVPRLIRTSVED